MVSRLSAHRIVKACHVLLVAAMLATLICSATPARVLRAARVSSPVTGSEAQRDGLRLAGVTRSPSEVKQAPPDGLSSPVWDNIQQQVRDAEYQYTWHEPSDAYTAPNRANGWRTALGAAGARVAPTQPSPSESVGKFGSVILSERSEQRISEILRRFAPQNDR